MGWNEETEYVQRVSHALEFANARSSASNEPLEQVVSNDMMLVEELLDQIENKPELLLRRINKTRLAFESGQFRHGSEVLIEMIRSEQRDFFGDLETVQLAENSGIKTWDFELKRMLGMIVRAEFDQDDWLFQMTEHTMSLPDGSSLTIDGTLPVGRKLIDDSVGKKFIPSSRHPWYYISIDGCSTTFIETVESRAQIPIELTDRIKAVVVYNAGLFTDHLWTACENDGTFWLVVPTNNSSNGLSVAGEEILLEQTITGYRHELRHCDQLTIAPELQVVPNYPIMEYDAITRQILDCNRTGLKSMATALEADRVVYWNMLSGIDSSSADAHINSLADRLAVSTINRLASFGRTTELRKYDKVLGISD